MAVKIVVNQTGKPAGVAGFAREDLDLVTPVVLTVSGGPFVQYLWTLLDKPVVTRGTPAQSNAIVESPTGTSTRILNNDKAGTCLVRLTVDSGNGLGASADDITEISFYAGPTLASDTSKLPRRRPAFLERLQHNVQNDPIFGILGNLRGWAQEFNRWFDLIEDAVTSVRNIRAWGLVNATGPALTSQMNITSVANPSTGVYTITFNGTFPNTDYSVFALAQGATPGLIQPVTKTTTTCTLNRYDSSEVGVNAAFAFLIVGPDDLA